MRVELIHDRARLAAFLERDRARHVYALGDLDDRFWGKTTWYGGVDEAGELRAVALLYCAFDPPSLLALDADHEAIVALLRAAAHLLPPRCHAHLEADCGARALNNTHTLDPERRYSRMILHRADAIEAVDLSPAERLGPADREDALRFYREVYPEGWFDPAMLATGHYFGARHDGRLVAVSGVHVCAEGMRVAALGNIATAPAHRRLGLGRALTAATCASLLDAGIDLIALNVRADNPHARALYESLGFVEAMVYDEVMIVASPPGPLSPGCGEGGPDCAGRWGFKCGDEA